MIELFTVENLIALLTLTSLEIVLGIDNIIVLAILTSKLPAHQQGIARNVGLALAMIMRIALLLSLAWIIGLKEPLFSFDFIRLDHDVSGRDLVLGLGGLFLIYKATREIHEEFEGGNEEDAPGGRVVASFAATIVQIVIMDMVFSLDSVITAVGMAKHVPVMVLAIMCAVGIMFFFAGPIARFVKRHPTIKILALAFLVLVGFALMADSLHFHVPKPYIYAAMAFSFVVEIINIRLIQRMRHRDEHRIRGEYTGAGNGTASGDLPKSAAEKADSNLS